MTTFESAAAFAVRRPVAVIVVALAVALVGYLSWRELPVDLLPDLQSPTVVVSIRSGNRPPTEMERLYGQSVERMLTTVRGSRKVFQVARTGRLVTTVTFDWQADLDLALVDVQKAVGGIEGDPEVTRSWCAVSIPVNRRFSPWDWSRHPAHRISPSFASWRGARWPRPSNSLPASPKHASRADARSRYGCP